MTSPSEPPRRLFSPTSEAERARFGQRIAWALPVALGLIALLVWLGPDAESIERKFTPYGDVGPLRLLPEISIDDDDDDRHQRAALEASPPEAAPEYQVEPEERSERAEETAPKSAEAQPDVPHTGQSEQDQPVSEVVVAADGDATVDMDLPSQTVDSDFIITRLVRPLYPARASAADRARPVITVTAGFFLDSAGTVQALIIQGNDGGPEFADVAREAMEQWEFKPRLRDGQPPAPRWLVVTWRFRSPYRPLNP